MSTNFDMIATVDINLASPVVSEASFGNLLIMGPGPTGTPKVAAKVIKDVSVYGSLEELQDDGYVTSGENADPVGVAARVAFSQSPAPSEVYVAIQKQAVGASGARQTISDTNEVITSTVGQKPGLTGCELTFDKDGRRLFIELTGAVTSVKNTGLVDTLTALTKKGYVVSVEGTEVTDAKSLKALPAFKDIAAMTKGSEPMALTVAVEQVGALGVSYEVVVSYPDPDAENPTGPSLGEPPLDNPGEALEAPTDTVARAVGTNGWYALCTAGIDPKHYEEIAAYIETTEKMFAYTEMGFFGAGEGGSDAPSVGAVYCRTMGVYGRENTVQADEDVPEANWYMNVAMVAAWLYYQPGSETAAFKKLAAVYPSDLSTGEMKALETAHLNYFITVGGRNVTMNGQVVGNEWCDIIRFRDWLKNDMQTRVVNLFITNPKVPYTDSGIALVQNQMIASLEEGTKAGGVAEDEFDEDGNTIPGFTTTVPLAASLTASEKASRKLTKCSFMARLAGAIHKAALTGTLTYESL